MPAPTITYPFRPMLTSAEVDTVYEYMRLVFCDTGYHISVHEALERLLRKAIQNERDRQHE